MHNNLNRSSKDVNDGFFEIAFSEDGVFLTVYPPVAKGKRVDTSEILEKLNNKRVKNFKREAVELAVIKADKMPVIVAGPQEEEKVDARASIVITPDKLKAFLTIIPPENGADLTADQILSAISDCRIVYGINKAAVEDTARFPVYNQMICVAEGTMPVNGQNGRVEFHFDSNKQRRPTILEDGRVDYRELNLIESIQKGALLCSLSAPLKGTNGRNVLGAEIAALDGKPAVLPRGRNVEASADGQSLIAAIDGQVNYIDGKVSVFSNYEVHADVDNSTGNIAFIGNVIVRGNVLSGFSVEAGGSVEVWGVVEGAVIKAGGDIVLRRGMQGIGKGVLKSGGSIIARYIEHSTLEAQNNITSEAIMHSNVKCGNKLELTGRKGLLVGGICKVGKEISAKVVGSHMATVTDIEVGMDPTLRERYKALKEEINTMEADMKKADQAISILKKIEAAGMLTPDKQEMMAKSVRTKIFFGSRVSELREEFTQIEAKLQQDAYGKIKIYNFIYPGSKVTIGSCVMYVKENLQYCTLYRDGADIRVGPIDK
ncbi:hypothetical protein DFR58_113123 [Anaerobacterium chartisolvens]|uniref:Flagellar Assembly Protein A N-terminal region domain-containing protein n=1 Tax=Anaerobacterium chartisolvens TaxID=1297424 RepID=A0A369B296_9FIRM|nr:FapA family protein [Anaerobacterium chartisolvens]RCX15541.1 hypothetical protein DFR58_113123 [Anaerobacterium chartisolvens]